MTSNITKFSRIITGPPGHPGDKGTPGIEGPFGDRGPIGVQGLPGRTGRSGFDPDQLYLVAAGSFAPSYRLTDDVGDGVYKGGFEYSGVDGPWLYNVRENSPILVEEVNNYLYQNKIYYFAHITVFYDKFVPSGATTVINGGFAPITIFGGSVPFYGFAGLLSQGDSSFRAQVHCFFDYHDNKPVGIRFQLHFVTVGSLNSNPNYKGWDGVNPDDYDPGTYNPDDPYTRRRFPYGTPSDAIKGRFRLTEVANFDATVPRAGAFYPASSSNSVKIKSIPKDTTVLLSLINTEEGVSIRGTAVTTMEELLGTAKYYFTSYTRSLSARMGLYRSAGDESRYPAKVDRHNTFMYGQSVVTTDSWRSSNTYYDDSSMKMRVYKLDLPKPILTRFSSNTRHNTGRQIKNWFKGPDGNNTRLMISFNCEGGPFYGDIFGMLCIDYYDLIPNEWYYLGYMGHYEYVKIRRMDDGSFDYRNGWNVYGGTRFVFYRVRIATTPGEELRYIGSNTNLSTVQQSIIGSVPLQLSDTIMLTVFGTEHGDDPIGSAVMRYGDLATNRDTHLFPTIEDRRHPVNSRNDYLTKVRSVAFRRNSSGQVMARKSRCQGAMTAEVIKVNVL